MTKRQNPEPTDELEEASDEKMYTSAPIENEDGDTYVIRQQNVGPGNEFGSGEWPDPHNPPSADPKPPEQMPG